MRKYSAFCMISGFSGAFLAFMLPITIDYVVMTFIIIILLLSYVISLPKMKYVWYERGGPRSEQLRSKVDRVLYLFWLFSLGFMLGIGLRMSTKYF